jgi:hypothetical protein
VIIDNASDVYDADPVNRQYVTQFMRALVKLLPDVAVSAVLLLAHVNRVTAKNGKSQSDTEGYADSAAWHNKARNRLFLNAIDDNGGLSLQHQKNNFGVKQPALEIRFRSDGSSLYVPDSFNDDSSDAIKAAKARKNKLAILALIHEFYGREEWISSEINSRSNTHAMLKQEPTYPFKDDRDGRNQCTALLRECHRECLLVDETYRRASREQHKWALTEKAVELLKWPSIVRDELED